MTSDDAARRRWRAHHETADAIFREWRDRGYPHPPPRLPSLAPDLADLRCGAKTRKGTPCKRKDLFLNGRCKLHGGLSTGPKTAKGKRRAAANLPYHPDRGQTP